MKRFLYVCIFCLFIFSISYAENISENETKEKVKSVLKDPDSAKFQNIKTVINSIGQESICGEVNARNSFGGYTGFSSFSYTNGTVIFFEENVHQYDLSGCAGPQMELEARLRNEADFSCNVIWNLLVNIIINKEDNDLALNVAVDAVKNRAGENGGSILPEQEKAIRMQFQESLKETLSNEKQVKAIKKDPQISGISFINSCSVSTYNLLKSQLGINDFPLKNK